MVLISGDGASGSSYLVWLLRELGFSICPKGYEHLFKDLPSGEPVLYELLREQVIRDDLAKGKKIEWPDVIKNSGGFSFNLHEWVDKYNWKVDLVLIPFRGLEEGIRRRWVKDPVHNPINHKFLKVPYEKFLSMKEDEINERAREVVRERVGAAVLQCTDRDYPFSILPFPKFVLKPTFLYEKLSPILKDVSFETFYEAFSRTTDLTKVKLY